MTTSLNSRPGTLREVVRRVEAGEQKFAVALGEFLDEFYLDADDGSRAHRLTPPPGLLDDAVVNAYIGAVGEHLARRWSLGTPPEWAEDRRRFLRHPWFPLGADAQKPILLAESPLAFRRRLLFVEAEPLRRARMPQDERWRAYEILRTGLLPDDEVEPSAA